jgi:hypothetical protein
MELSRKRKKEEEEEENNNKNTGNKKKARWIETAGFSDYSEGLRSKRF